MAEADMVDLISCSAKIRFGLERKPKVWIRDDGGKKHVISKPFKKISFLCFFEYEISF